MQMGSFCLVAAATVALATACVQDITPSSSLTDAAATIGQSSLDAGGNVPWEANGSTASSTSPTTGISIVLPASTSMPHGGFTLQIPTDLSQASGVIVSNVFDLKWTFPSDPNHYQSLYGIVAYDSRSANELSAADSSGRWTLLANLPFSAQGAFAQVPSGPPSSGIKIGWSFESDNWGVFIDNQQTNGRKEDGLTSSPSIGAIDGSEMTIEVNSQIEGTVAVLELTDLSVGVGEGELEACPAVRVAKDTVVAQGFSLASDKKTCTLSRVKFSVGQR